MDIYRKSYAVGLRSVAKIVDLFETRRSRSSGRWHPCWSRKAQLSGSSFGADAADIRDGVCQFSDRHFTAAVEAKATLGVVRKFDSGIGDVVELYRWDICSEGIYEVREAIQFAKKIVKLSR